MRPSPRLLTVLLWASAGCHVILPLDGAGGSAAGEAADLKPPDAPGADAPGPDWPRFDGIGAETSLPDSPWADTASPDGPWADGPWADAPGTCGTWAGWTCLTYPSTIECAADCGGSTIRCYSGNGDCSCYQGVTVVKPCSGMGGTTACNRCATAFQKGCCD